MADATTWISAVRGSHDRVVALLTPLDDDAVQAQSYASEWTIADVASHLGSGAEIFDLFLTAVLNGNEPPGNEAFGPIWDRWNALPPAQQVSESIAANEAFVSRLEQIPEAARATFELSLFGMDLDLAGLAGMRLGEHALHTWDIEVALDPTALLAPASTELLIDGVPRTAGFAGKPAEGHPPISISTTAPSRQFVLTAAPAVELAAADKADADALVLPAEAFIRAVYGRLDPDHTPAGLGDDERVATLREVFPGF